MSTYGPAYSEALDGERIRDQLATIRDLMLDVSGWLSLSEIEAATGYAQASISAQLRHLRKERFGGFTVEKRRRRADGGTWEYKVTRP